MGRVTRRAAIATLSAKAPSNDVVLAFEYLPGRDGLALLTGGPTDVGYAANKASNPSRIWQPRLLQPGDAVDPKGGYDSASGSASLALDPEYAWSNGYSPYAVVGSDLRIRAARTSTLGFQVGEIPTDPVTGLPFEFISGELSTRNSFLTRFSYVEIVAKIPYATASWPALWLYPETYQGPPEIDILESPGGSPGFSNTHVLSTLHYGPRTNRQKTAIDYNAGVDLTAGFHRYGVMWTDAELKFYVDGVVTNTVSLTDKPETDVRYHIVLSNPIGSNINGWVPRPDGTTPDTLDLLVRSVRVWHVAGPAGLSLSSLTYADNLTVGGTVATISAINQGVSTGNTFAEVSDPDGMFAVSGNNLTLAQVVPATTKDTHAVSLSVTDAQGRTRQKAFNIGVITGTPVQTNYITQQDLTDASWTKEGLTAPNSTTVMQTTANSLHRLYRGAITRAAGVKTFNTWADVTPGLGVPYFSLQVFDGTFGHQAVAWFNLDAMTKPFTNATGSFSAASSFLAELPNGKVRVGMKFTTDAATTNFWWILNMFSDTGGTATFVGDTSRGIGAENMWLYNMGAGAGGS